jgi:flagellar motor switch protein FliN
MNTNTQSFPSWLKQIPGELFKLDEKPLLGFPSTFSWETFSAALGKSLQMKNLSISPGTLQWLSQTEILAGLGDQLKSISLSVNPLPGQVTWIMPEKGLVRIMHLLLNPSSSTFPDTLDANFIKAFNQFLAAEAINALEKTDFDKKLVPVAMKESHMPAEACLGLDITILLDNEPIYGRLLLSQEFRRSWAQRFALQQKTLPLSSPIADALQVVIHLEAGKVNLKPSEWKQIVPGDFVALDACSLDPEDDKGRVMLVINGTPFFRAKIKQGSIKILEHPLYHEVNTAMDTPKKNEEEEFDDADFDIEEEGKEDKEEKKHEEEKHPAGEEFSDEDFDISDEDAKAEAKPASAKTPEPAPAAEAKAAISQTPLVVDEIPLPVVIEVGRIQMSVKKLLELQPGNMLELDIHPESGVDLVVNGKRIARGELLKIGESLGIRISELS